MSGAVLFTAPFAVSASSVDLPEGAQAAEVVFLGEQHDNPQHHETQAEWVKHLSPRAIVFEMLTPEQAAKATAENRRDEAALEAAFGWEEAGWPDFTMYFPIFAAVPEAAIVGAGVPRSQIRALMEDDLAQIIGMETAQRFALDRPLPDGQQEARETLQREAHCNALPEEMLPMMVNVQRLRDAALAQAALEAVEQFGTPVVVITGNGHAREDWGAPSLLRQAAPDLTVFTLGQGEAGQTPEGGFAFVLDAPPVDRGNPCDAFK
ncbi:MAG: ChaN family lipoprotein [Pseudomonadota bacterium]